MRAHQGRVYGLCLSILADSSLAEDAAQETFLKAYRSLSKFKGGSSFSTWLYRIAANHCKDLLRRRRSGKTQSLDELIERHGGERFENMLEIPSESGNAGNEELLRKLLQALPEDYRAVLLLREREGMSYQEIAESLDISLDAVKARLKRARAELARHFSSLKNV